METHAAAILDRLRAVHPPCHGPVDLRPRHVNPDGPAAAELIETLLQSETIAPSTHATDAA